jgi:hypothetical protein
MYPCLVRVGAVPVFHSIDCDVWQELPITPATLQRTRSMKAPSPSTTIAASPASTTSMFQISPPSVTYNFVNNEMVLSKTGAWTMVHDPVCLTPGFPTFHLHVRVQKASRRLLTRVPDSTYAEIQQVVSIAQAAYKDWRKVSFTKRRSKMLRFMEIVRQNSQRIVRIP